MRNMLSYIIDSVMGRSKENVLPQPDAERKPLEVGEEKVFISNGIKFVTTRKPDIVYKNHPNKPNNTEPKHPDDLSLKRTTPKITWAQRMEFKKRAEARRAAAAEED